VACCSDSQEWTVGTKGQRIIGMDVHELLPLLDAAYASEWLATCQYWLGARVIKGPMKGAVAAELTRHATEEPNHASLLVECVIQSRGNAGHWPQAVACARKKCTGHLTSWGSTSSPGTRDA
jgi:hypothetical protein